MTRKTALKMAIEAIKQSNYEDNLKEEVTQKLLLCIDELPFAKWTEAAIFDACDQFIEDNNKPITTRDFECAGLPSHPTIKNRFGMTAQEFRDKYYPFPINYSDTSPYRDMTAQEIASIFKEEYERINAMNRDDYDKRRDRSAPCAATVMKKVGAKTCEELYEKCGVKKTIKSDRRGERTMYATFKLAYERELDNVTA